MKITRAANVQEARALFEHLNACHDASVRELLLKKQREVDEQDGSLIYPDVDVADFVLCEVQMELILNSYEGAKTDQIVQLEFEQVREFTFKQDRKHDFSDLYEVVIQDDDASNIRVIFYSTKDRIIAADLLCESIVCREL